MRYTITIHLNNGEYLNFKVEDYSIKDDFVIFLDKKNKYDPKLKMFHKSMVEIEESVS